MSKLFAIIFPRGINLDFANVIGKIIGGPFCKKYITPSDTEEIWFYREGKWEDAEEIRYCISQYLANVFRKTEGHHKFVLVHEFLNDCVRIVEDRDATLFELHGPLDVVINSGLCSVV